jgi:DNA-binding response OmpR family regulator
MLAGMTGGRRILALDQDEAFLKAAERLLGKAGMELLAVREPAQLPSQLEAFQPDLVLLDRAAPGTGFAQVAEVLRDSNVPLVYVLADAGEKELVRAVRAHGVEVMIKPFGEAHVARISALLEELSKRPKDAKLSWEEKVARNFMDLARRHKLRGSLVVNRGTPFEGRVVLKDGALLRATYGPLTGMDAVREILQLEDGLYELDASLDAPVERVAHSAVELEEGKGLALTGDAAGLRPRLLVVDDEPDIVLLLGKSLSYAGFEVTASGDGRDAIEQALKAPFDLIMADLSMPKLDGWEMLKMLKSDHRTSEVPVVIVSAHDDYRETLRAARAGAYDYLAKTGRSDAYVASALRAITPRLDAMFQLLVSHPLEVRTQAIGLQWLLRALARLKATGSLALADDWGAYRVDVQDGRPVAAVLEVQRRKVTGLAAFVRMMVATTAHGTFRFGPVPPAGPGGLSMTMEELILRTCETLNGAEARANVQRLEVDSEFEVDHELYELFCRIAPPKKVAFARAVIDRQLTMTELSKALGMPPEQGAEWSNELLRRGVIKRPARGTRSPVPGPPKHAPPSAADRRAALLGLVRAELGQSPWVGIAEALEISLISKLDREMSFQDIVQFARARGYDWRDVYVVVAKLTFKGFLIRTSLGADIAPPQLVPGPDHEDKQLQAWTEWARRAQSSWRSALGK